MSRAFCRFMATKVLGWTLEGEPPKEDKCIILGAPHTSIWDFIVSYFFYRGIGGDTKFIIKAEFFKGPLKWILRGLGAIPVDRSRGANFIIKTVEAVKREEKCHLSLSPEGTRKPVKNWKGGFHLMAKMLDIPVYLGYFDWATKCIGIGPRFELTDDCKADIERIKLWYKEKGVVGKHPQKFVCD